MAVQLSIIVPLFNEEGNIPLMYAALKEVISKLNLSHEIIFIDDGSTDNSFEVILNLAKQNASVRGLSLSRNFGHQIALTAGLEASIGEAVISMDADMQHPPEVIIEMYKKYKEGFDIVNTIRKEPESIGILKKATSSFFYKLINNLSDVHIQPASADFRLMSRKTVDAYAQIKEKARFTRGLVSWLGYKQTFIHFEANERASGVTKYTLKKMIRFAVNGITSFSSKPLRISFFVGLAVACTGMLYALYAVYKYFTGVAVQGWTSILLCVLIIGGIQLVSIGVLGEYLALVFNESKNRPLYFVKEDTKNK